MGSCISLFTAATHGTYVSPGPGRVTSWFLDASYIVSSGTSWSTSVMSALAAPVQVRRAASDSIAWPADPTVPHSALPVPAPPPIDMPLIGPEIYLSVSVLIALVLLGVGFYLIRARRAKKKAAMNGAGVEMGVLEKAELGGECVVPHESGGSTRVELDTIEAVRGVGVVAELEVPIAELEGDVAAGDLGIVGGDGDGEVNIG